MQSSLYVALSAQVALQDRLETVAQNVANGNTAGYRGTEVKFDSVLSNLGADPVAFVSPGSQVIKQLSGGLSKTGNPLDVAVKGNGWLSVASAQGPVYTRDGRMHMNAAGGLVALSGAPMLDAGGTPVQARSGRGTAANRFGWNDQPERKEDYKSWPCHPARQRQAFACGGRRNIQRSGRRRVRFLGKRRCPGLCGGLQRKSDHGDYQAGLCAALVRRRHGRGAIGGDELQECDPDPRIVSLMGGSLLEAGFK